MSRGGSGRKEGPGAVLVKDILRRFPSKSSTELAKILSDQHPSEFETAESARNIIRYYRGTIGPLNRECVRPESFIPKINIPASDRKDYTPFLLKETDGPIIIAGDVHIPYHDQDALEIFIERAVEMNAKTLIMAGDWIDMYQVSRFQKDPRKRSIKEELDMFKDIIGVIRKALPSARLIFKYGNHEERFDNYLMANAPDLYELPEIHLTQVVGFEKLGIEIVKNHRVIRFGHLNIIHGHEYVFSISNPVNPARGLYNRSKKNTMCFHHHQSSEHSESSITGESTTCWSVGCMCELHPEYMPLNKWNLGFAEIYPEDDGMFRVQNRRIINYRLI